MEQKELGNFRLVDRTFSQAGFKAITHLKLAHPEDLRKLIAAHTDTQGRFDGDHIKKITLSHPDVTDADVALLQKFTSLEAVNFTGCHQITNIGITALPPGLKKGNFTGCPRITDESIATLLETIKVLNITGCPNISSTMIENLRQRRVDVITAQSMTAEINSALLQTLGRAAIGQN